MRTLMVVLALLGTANICIPAEGQTFIGTGRYQYDDSTDADPTDNIFRIGNASATAGSIGAGTYVGGDFSLIQSANAVQIGTGTTNPVTLQIIRGWGSLIMLDGNLNLEVPGQSAFIGRGNGTAFVTQVGGVLTMGAPGKETFFGAAATSGGFPQSSQGLGEAYVELRDGTMVFKGTPRVGAYNYWLTPVGSGFPSDPTGMNIGRMTITGGMLDNSVASGGENFFIGFTGGDGRVEVLNDSVARFATLYVGPSDDRTYTLTSQGNTVTGYVARDSNGVLRIGKDADVAVDTAFGLFESNKNVELQIEIASLTDFSQIRAGSINIGQRWSTLYVAQEPVLTVSLLEGFIPSLGDEWAIGLTTGGVTLDGGFRQINAPVLPDPDWSYEVRVEGNNLVLAVVPEPATLALLGLGFLRFVRRRR